MSEHDHQADGSHHTADNTASDQTTGPMILVACIGVAGFLAMGSAPAVEHSPSASAVQPVLEHDEAEAEPVVAAEVEAQDDEGQPTPMNSDDAAAQAAAEAMNEIRAQQKNEPSEDQEVVKPATPPAPAVQKPVTPPVSAAPSSAAASSSAAVSPSSAASPAAAVPATPKSVPASPQTAPAVPATPKSVPAAPAVPSASSPAAPAEQ